MAKTNPLLERNTRLNFVKRLQKTANTWQRFIDPALKHSYKMWKAVAAGYYDDNRGAMSPVNLMDRGISTLVPFLVDGPPKVLVETKIPEYRPWAYTTQLALNHFLRQNKFAERVLIPVARNSMISAGITRTSIMHHRNYEREEGVYKIGTPHVEVIEFANYVGDPSARHREEFVIEGDIYRLPTDYAKEFFGPKFADDITSDGRQLDEWNPDQILSYGFDRDALAIRDFTTFIDIYLYDEGTILTIMPEGKKARVIREVEWDGPEGGPYDFLGFKYISQTPIPLPPAWAWHDMDVTMNLLIEKMRQQAEAQKNLIAVQGEEDANKLRNAPNNGIVTFDNLELIKELSVGGVNEVNYSWVSYIEDQFTKTGGNADVLGGRGPDAPTLGQEKMIYQNATRIVGHMYNRFHEFTRSILDKMAWAFWVEPTTYVPVVKEVPGTMGVKEIFRDRDKVGEFYDFTFDIIPYSSQREVPESKYNKLMMFLSQWIVPTIQVAAAQGAQLNVPQVTELLGDYLGIDNMHQWYKTGSPTSLAGLVNYKMMPLGMSDAFGATGASRETNMMQQQARAGGQSSPDQETGKAVL
jgi:hypothetical protein